MSSNDQLDSDFKVYRYSEYVVKFDGSEDYSAVIVEFPCEAGANSILVDERYRPDLNLLRNYKQFGQIMPFLLQFIINLKNLKIFKLG